MKTVVIVGVGALGSHVVQFLRNEDVRLRIIDFDRVERKNTMSQFHAKSSVGRNKVMGLAKTMDFLWGVKVDQVGHKLTSDNTGQLLGGYDVIVDCLDNAPARKLVSEYGWAEGGGSPILHGALAPEGGFGRVIWNDDFEADEGGEGAATCEDGAHLPFIAITAAYMARAVQVYLATGRHVGYQIAPTGMVIAV